MSIYINKNNLQSGPFEENDVLAWLKNGQLSPEDFAFRQGASDWQPLKVLFSSPAQSPIPAAVAVSAASGASQGFYNRPVVNWARQTLQNPVAVKLKHDSLFLKIILYSALFFVPAVFLIFAVFRLLTIGFVSQTIPLFIFVAVVTLPFALIVLLIRFTRKSLTRYLDADGAETLYGKKHRWEKLHFINHKKVRRSQGGLIGVLIHAIMFSGSERTTVELVFETGKAVIPPLAYNQAELLNLVGTIPAQRRDEGTIRQ